jgi:hypothetical protein
MTCVWCGICWSDVAAFDGRQAEVFSLARAGGPWCHHHFRRHASARAHQLTGQLAVLAMTLPSDTPQHVPDGRLHTLVGDPSASIILATADAGAGKSTWAARHALARADREHDREATGVEFEAAWAIVRERSGPAFKALADYDAASDEERARFRAALAEVLDQDREILGDLAKR